MKSGKKKKNRKEKKKKKKGGRACVLPGLIHVSGAALM